MVWIGIEVNEYIDVASFVWRLEEEEGESDRNISLPQIKCKESY